MDAGFGAMAGISIFMIIYFVFIAAYLAVGIYCLVLFIKLALRGIKALDIYIANDKKEEITAIEGE